MVCEVRSVLADGKVQVGAKEHTELKWGSTTTTKQEWKKDVSLTMPPKTTLRVTAAVTESVIHVPVTTMWKSAKTGKTMKTTGVFKGLSSSDLSTYYFPIGE